MIYLRNLLTIMPHMKLLFSIIAILVVSLLSWAIITSVKTPAKPQAQITSFEDCAKAGYLVMESYPRQCKTPEGASFTEVISPESSITYTNATADLIAIELPFPGAVVGKQFSVIGKARGMWFFEASFPIEILDKNGAVLATGIAQAQSDWMTTEFVSFKADITIPATYVGVATLVAKKDNPSGLPEHDGSISFPLTIEY